jgi:transposase
MNEVNSRKRKYNTLSDDTHNYIINLYTSGIHAIDISKQLKINYNTVKSNILRYKKNNQINKKHKGGNHKTIISDTVKKIICDTQDNNNSIRYNDIIKIINKKRQPAPSFSSVHRVLKENNFTTKQLYQIPKARNSIEIKDKRKEWCINTGPTLHSHNTIFIDESPFCFCITRTRGRSRKGVKAVSIVPQIRGKNHTLIAAISPTHGIIHYQIKVSEREEEFISKRKGSKKVKTKPKGVTRDVFRNFILTLLDNPIFHSPSSSSSSSSSSPITYHFIYDNAQIHKGDIDEVIFSSGHTAVPLPPYSPALNPIEYAFSKWKLIYRSLPHSTDSLVDKSIKQASKQITSTDCLHWFEHTQTLYKNCVDMKDM